MEKLGGGIPDTYIHRSRGGDSNPCDAGLQPAAYASQPPRLYYRRIGARLLLRFNSITRLSFLYSEASTYGYLGGVYEANLRRYERSI